MSILGGDIDFGKLAGQVGLTEDQVKKGGQSLLTKLQAGSDAPSAAAAASAETGIDASKLLAMLPALAAQFGATPEGLIQKLGLEGDGVMGKIGGFLDRNHDGKVGDDFTKLFGNG